MSPNGPGPQTEQQKAWESVHSYANKIAGIALRALDDQLMDGPIQRAIINALVAKSRTEHQHSVAQWDRAKRLMLEHMARIDLAMDMLNARRDWLDGITPDADPRHLHDQSTQGANKHD